MSAPTARVSFLIANDRHHTSAALPVIDAIRRSGSASCSVLSLCEFRGFESPVLQLRELGVPLQELVPFRLRTPSAGQSLGAARKPTRSLLRDLLWHGLLAPSLVECLAPHPNIVVVPNDGAYPYDRICRLLARLRIPFLVLQEGIRFARPSSSSEGRSAAAAWAVWGESSAQYFLDQGAPRERVHVTGSPRFDDLVTRDWSPEASQLQHEISAGRPLVTLLSNPIDDLGFVSRDEKLELLRKLADALTPQLEARGWHLVVKLHGRESESAVRRALRLLPHGSRRISVVTDCPLYPLLKASQGALTFASSVGLEALLADVPLAVLEIPGHGFAHDFVSSGSAKGIAWSRSLEEQLRAWMTGDSLEPASAAAYLERHVAHPGSSATRVAHLIQRQLPTSERAR